jgi:hypothetical protein
VNRDRRARRETRVPPDSRGHKASRVLPEYQELLAVPDRPARPEIRGYLDWLARLALLGHKGILALVARPDRKD